MFMRVRAADDYIAETRQSFLGPHPPNRYTSPPRIRDLLIEAIITRHKSKAAPNIIVELSAIPVTCLIRFKIIPEVADE